MNRIILALILTLNISAVNAQQDMMVRVAEIEVHPEYLSEYRDILKVEAAASIQKETGVIAIFPMFEQKQHHQIRIVEIYANRDAYEAHLKTAHFLHYKTATAKMVKALKLVEMEALDKQTMSQIFKKLQ
ncbi:putative quinol monooxygenase [Niastella sp. OAS944]|uniref:putative quinol monooxygenase n=1 Tax=Niastella sp. OAS944 TaxID=2664089 RepID=UPI003469A647|nr:quinol monooxygenase YgiN [Chitinophagaceae bacterium OAS944]